MSAYVEVELTNKPRCSRARCPDISHYVRARIGPAIMEPFTLVTESLRESHEGAMLAKYSSMAQHRRKEPKCSYCIAIKYGRNTLWAIKGRGL